MSIGVYLKLKSQKFYSIIQKLGRMTLKEVNQESKDSAMNRVTENGKIKNKNKQTLGICALMCYIYIYKFIYIFIYMYIYI